MDYVVLLVLGLGAVGYGVHQAVLHYRLRRHGIRVRGLVARYESSPGTGGSGPTTYTVVEFIDDQGRACELRDQATGRRRLRVGDGAPVLFLPGAPGNARVDIAGRRLGEYVPFLVACCLFVGYALWR
ncbi:DUF3592 domain-containing protein [Streptomyces sp. CLV115]|uniref:DUF3592 domain-containing protein n=1 Tax=Streptomyces sp. CLV115 TaxID=3138502 RepID=UPI00313E813F